MSMAVSQYRAMSVEWMPDSSAGQRFNTYAIVVLTVLILIGIVFNLINLPAPVIPERVAVPPRIAQFIEERRPPPPPPVEVPRPEPKPIPQVEIPQAAPRVEREPERPAPEPLTKQQQAAREVASQTGLLALASEMADLMDTTEVSAQVGSTARASDAANQTANFDRQRLTANVGQGSGGIDGGQYAGGGVGGTALAAGAQANVKNTLLSEAQAAKAERAASNQRGSRSEEDIALIFDRNKGVLQSLYMRAKRTNAGLKGQMVMAITIAPNGSVINVKLVSSTLGDPTLERRILSRVKTFNFGARSISNNETVQRTIDFFPT